MKIRTRIQRKEKKKIPLPSTSYSPIRSRPFTHSADSASRATDAPTVQTSPSGGHHLANISILPPEEEPQLQELSMQSRDSEGIQLQAEEEETSANPQLEESLEVLQGNEHSETIQRAGGGRHAPVDDRHNITDPYLEPARWLETLKRERVADLFRTAGGLDGHVQQIQGEINRLISDRNQQQKLSGKTGEETVEYTTALDSLRQALISSAKGATFDFPKFGLTLTPLASDLYLERTNGKLKVDGKAV
ncbi:hypothetical protein [Phormidium sp. CCY1219]|uniref:hypothetical protein n=1 Tax=Phormidium sp. CCY1219 TaxID=2886104 RepID=UPI002D1F4900|nr:hypothetical protein [Phormidium sp. CCY1219]MEB3826365.1 hypothetical protein [Phormidium sp. CCY1219]